MCGVIDISLKQEELRLKALNKVTTGLEQRCHTRGLV